MSTNLDIRDSLEKIKTLSEELIQDKESGQETIRLSKNLKKSVDVAFPLVESFAEDPENVWNTDYKLCSELFRNLLEEIFPLINRPYSPTLDDFPNEIQDEYWKFVDSLHLLIAFSKRVKKYISMYDLEIVRKWKAVVDAFLPVAILMKNLKSEGKIKKGRKPSEGSESNPSSINPNKIVKTCPCCFRQIAIRKKTTKDGKETSEIVNHGYHRPGWGFLTNGCIGVGFPALEDSPKGLEHLLSVLKDTLSKKETELFQTDWEQAVFTLNPSRFSKKSEPTEIRKGHPRFEMMKQRTINGLKSSIKYLKDDIEHYDKVLSNWETDWKGRKTAVL